MKRQIFILFLAFFCGVSAYAQTDRSEVRSGNRKFRRGDFGEAEIFYRKAALKDSNSVAAQYNLASSLYRQEDYEGAAGALSKLSEVPGSDIRFNEGDVALQKKDYGAAVEAFRKSLLLNPGDMDAKENYLYAKKMLQDSRNQGGGGSDDNQDQDQQDQNQQDQNQQDQQDQQDQNQQDQNQQDQDRQDQNQQQEGQISRQQAQQMLKAIQAKEKETQDKVNKEKAALLKSRQKEKNW